MNGSQQQKVVDKKQEGSAEKQSPASSPSHEFSFTVVSLHSSSNTVPGKTKTPPSMAIDLSPADDIFFHGHLLPLHLLSHLPVSPRCSTNSLDGICNAPLRELLDEPKPDNYKPGSTNCRSKTDSNIRSKNKNHVNGEVGNFHQGHNVETKGRPKSKSFSLSGLTRWHHHHKERGVTETEEKEEHKTKMRFDLKHVLKRYLRMVRPLLVFRGRRENRHLHRQSRSFSGHLSSRDREKDQLRARRGDCYSAPTSMRTSPTNSGLLVATTGYSSSTSDSSMEELQSAIQAAIAHCKNSIKGEDKFKSQA